MTFHIEPCEHGYQLSIFYRGVSTVQWCGTLDEALTIVHKEFAQ